jgi:hypothetical protein
MRQMIPDLGKKVITDSTACVGGDTLLFSLWFKRVESIEWKHDNLVALQNNVDAFGASNVNIHQGDSTKIFNWRTNVLYIDPPWGGPDYKEKKELDLSLGSHRVDVFLRDSILATAAAWKPQWILLKLPFNYNWNRLEVLEGIESVNMLRIRNYRIVVMKVQSEVAVPLKKMRTRRARRI